MNEPVHSPDQLKSRLRRRASDLGFDLFGVTTPDPPPHLDVYQRWLDHDRHGQMAYLATDRAHRVRSDPRRLLSSCQSILVLGMNYLPHDPAPAERSQARVAAYALGDDYHNVIPQRLERLIADLESWVGRSIPHRIHTDTGPILERELAQRAGLGWIGKNTCLIHPQRGSYFFLAEVLLGLGLPADQPMRADHCGSCTRCLEACPTACILPDRTLDASRCISYLTIELRGDLTAEQRRLAGDWVFGCDVCQQVCPWNQRFAEPTDDPVYQTRPFLQQAGLTEFLQLDTPAYQEAMRGSPLKRAKRAGLVRNAAAAAGNLRLVETAQALEGVLKGDPAPEARATAAWALAQIEPGRARPALLAALAQETDPAVRREIEKALPDRGARETSTGE
jgi:epoxyqueuosine reductase